MGRFKSVSKASLCMVAEARCGSMLFTPSVSCLTYQTLPFPFPFPSWIPQSLAIIASQGHLCNGMPGVQTIAILTPTTSHVYGLILGMMAKPESILCINRCTEYTQLGFRQGETSCNQTLPSVLLRNNVCSFR